MRQDKLILRREVLELYKNNPFLWNCKLKDYTNRYKRTLILEDFSAGLNMKGEYSRFRLTSAPNMSRDNREFK